MEEQRALKLFEMVIESAKFLYKRDGYLEPVLIMLQNEELKIIPTHEIMRNENTKELGATILQQYVNKNIPELIIVLGEAKIHIFNTEEKRWEFYDNAAYVALEFIDDSGQVQSYSCMMVLDPEKREIIREQKTKCDKAGGKFSFLSNMLEEKIDKDSLQ
jgi:hypothetical protein